MKVRVNRKGKIAIINFYRFPGDREKESERERERERNTIEKDVERYKVRTLNINDVLDE